MKYILMGLVIVLFLGLGIWYSIYNYGECKQVGHSRFYCVMHFGK